MMSCSLVRKLRSLSHAARNLWEKSRGFGSRWLLTDAVWFTRDHSAQHITIRGKVRYANNGDLYDSHNVSSHALFSAAIISSSLMVDAAKKMYFTSYRWRFFHAKSRSFSRIPISNLFIHVSISNSSLLSYVKARQFRRSLFAPRIRLYICFAHSGNYRRILSYMTIVAFARFPSCANFIGIPMIQKFFIWICVWSLN